MNNCTKKADEQSLLEKARAGDFDAFAALAEPCRESVCAWLVQSGLATQDDAEDLFNDALIRAHKAIDKFQKSSAFRTWLSSIARNLALDAERARVAHPVASLDAPISDSDAGSLLTHENIAFDASSEDAQLEEMDCLARGKIIRAALDKLPETSRTVLEMFYFQELPYNEIAEKLQVPIGTVMSRLHNGKKQLFNELAPFRSELDLV